MTDWSAFFPYVLPAVRGCDEDTATLALREAATEFCARSQCWKQEIPLTSVAGVSDYLVPFPAGSVGSMLVSLSVLSSDGIPVDTYDVVDPAYGRDMMRNQSCGAFAFLGDDALTLYVLPAPDVAGLQVLPYFSLKPSSTAASIPDFLFEQYRGGIVSGALARLLKQPKAAWADGNAAAVEQANFIDRVGSASSRAGRGAARGRSRARGFFF